MALVEYAHTPEGARLGSPAFLDVSKHASAAPFAQSSADDRRESN
jgi:hypothetical protein